MPITPTVLTEAIDTANSTQYVTSTLTPSAGSLVLVVVNSRSTSTNGPTVSGLGATWVAVEHQLFGNAGPGSTLSRLSLFRAMGSGIGSGALTVSFNPTARSAYWRVVQMTGVSTQSTDGAGAILQATNKSDFSVGQMNLNFLPLANTSNITFGVWGQERNEVWTTAGGLIPLGSATFAEQNSMFIGYEVNSTRLSAVDGGSSALDVRGAVGVEIAEQAQPVQDLFGSISVPTTATASGQVTHNLGGTASVATTASGRTDISGTQELSGSIFIPVVVSDSIGLEHKLQAAQAVASVVVTGDMRVVGQDIEHFTRTAQDFDFQGELRIKHQNRQRLRKLLNPSSPRHTQQVDVTTAVSVVDMRPFQNARFALFIPPSTNTSPYRLFGSTNFPSEYRDLYIDLYAVQSSRVGVPMSSRNPSLISLAEGSTGLYLATSVESASIPVRLRLL